MAEFASAGKGSAALATGITGLSIAGLQAIAPGGILSGILAPRPPYPPPYPPPFPPPPPQPDPYTALLAENTLLKSNQYTDQSTLETKLEVARQAERLQAMKEQQALYNQIIDGKIALSTQTATAAFQQSQQAIQYLQNTVSQVILPFVPGYKVNPPWPPPPTTTTGTTTTTTGGNP